MIIKNPLKLLAYLQSSIEYRLDIMFRIWILNGIYTHRHSSPLGREIILKLLGGQSREKTQLKSFFFASTIASFIILNAVLQQNVVKEC